MIELLDEPLRDHTTLRIGGPARMLVPECRSELVEIVTGLQSSRLPYVLLGRGSNVLANDEPLGTTVVRTTDFDADIDLVGRGLVEVGASLRLQRFINFCVSQDLFGMEWLYSVPGNIGGAIAMNAGRGASSKTENIGRYLVSVETLTEEGIVTLPANACRFGHRRSIFQEKPWVVLRARFQLPEQAAEIGRAKVAERMAFVRRTQDTRYPNAGSVFSAGTHQGVLTKLRGRGGERAQFSTKTANWIINSGNASFAEVYQLIRMARRAHLLRGHRVPRLEWRLVR